MADDSPPELAVPTGEAGTAFRLEMWASNMLLGYWWVLAVAIAAVLAGVAVYGLWNNAFVTGQKDTSAATAEVFDGVIAALVDDDKLTALEQQQTRGLPIVPTPGNYGLEISGYNARVNAPLASVLEEAGKDDVDQAEVLTRAGDRLMAVHAEGSGVAADHAALLASEMYRIAEKTDGVKTALTAATDSGAPAIAWAATAGLADLHIRDGEVDEAAALIRPWMAESKGFQGQQAALALGQIYVAVDREGDAKAAFQELRNVWPESPLLDQVDTIFEEQGWSEPSAAEAMEVLQKAASDGATGEGTALPAEGTPDDEAPAEDAPAEGAPETAPEDG